MAEKEKKAKKSKAEKTETTENSGKKKINKKVLAIIIAVVLVLGIGAGVATWYFWPKEPGTQNNDELETPPDTIALVTDDDLVKAEDVTAITAAVDNKGNVTDKTGIIDKEGHKVYSTGQKDEHGNLIYTTGKVDSKGNVLYTKNIVSTFNQLVYYTGKYNEEGKLILTQTGSRPDYTTNDRPTAYSQTTTTTATVGYEDDSKVNITDTKRQTISYFGGSKTDTFFGTAACDDGGFVTAGQSQSVDGDLAGVSKEWAPYGVVVKHSADGKLLWKYTLGGDSYVCFNDVTELKDKTIIAVGYTMATDIEAAPLRAKSHSALIVKLDKNGSLMWMYSFPGDPNEDGEWLECVDATPDGGFAAGGKAVTNKGFFKSDDDSIKAFVFKFDKNCNIKWRKTLSGSMSNNFMELSVNDKGDVFAACVTASNDGDFAGITYHKSLTVNTVLVKLDKKGNLEWSHYLEGSGNSEYKAICATEDGGCVVGGYFTVNKKADGIYSMTYGKADGYVIRYDKSGNVCWTRVVGGTGNDYINAITEIDGGFVIVGQTTSADGDFRGEAAGGLEDGFLMYLNGKGETSAKMLFDGSDVDSATGVCTLKDGSVAVTGWTKSKNSFFNKSNADKQSMGYFATFTAVTK